MAANFEVKFIVDRVSANYKIQITDTSTDFTLVKANTKITFPDGYVIENTDVSNPDISSAGGSVQKNLRLDVNNKPVTGDYKIKFIGYDASDNEYTSQKQFNFTFSEPSILIQDLSDSGIPVVKFKDITSWTQANFTASATTREFNVDYPSTSAVDGQSKTESNTNLSTPLEIDMVNSLNYYEGVYDVTLALDITYTHTNGYLSVQYKKNSTQDFPIKRTPSQSDLLNKINQYKENIDEYKVTSPDVYARYAEEYDNVLALYSHAVSRYKLGIGDGAQDSIEELLDLINDRSGHVYRSTPITAFSIDENDFGANALITKLKSEVGTFDEDGNLQTIAKAFADEVFEVEATDFKAEASKLSTLLAQFGTYDPETDTFSFLATADYFEQVKTYADDNSASAVALDILFAQFGSYDPETETFTFSSTSDYFNEVKTYADNDKASAAALSTLTSQFGTYDPETDSFTFSSTSDYFEEVKTYADNDKASAQSLSTLTSQFGSYDPNTNTFTFDNTADYFEQVKTYADENSAAANKVSSIGSSFGSFDGNTFNFSEAKITEELNTYTGLNFSNSQYFIDIEAEIDSKPIVLRQDAEPAVTYAPGSLWYDTNDDNKVYVLVEGDPKVWTLTDDSRIGATATHLTTLTSAFGSYDAETGFEIDTTANYFAEVKSYADTDSAAATKIENLGAELVTFDSDGNVTGVVLSSSFKSAVDSFVSDENNSALASKVEGIRVDLEGTDGNGGLTASVSSNSSAIVAKPDVFRQDDAPAVTEAVGSLWFDTNDNNKAYVLVAGTPNVWTETRDQGLISDISDKPFIFRQDDAPATTNPVGSLWYDTTNNANTLYVLVGDGGDPEVFTWTTTQDSDIATAQATADGRPKVFRQDAEPATSNPEFSIWYDTDDNNLTYILLGDGGDPEQFSWTATIDGRVTDLLDFAESKYSLTADADGVVTGLELYSASGPNTTVSTFKITADKFIVRESSTDFVPFALDGTQLKLDVPLNGVSGSFSGSLTAATGTFSGNVDGKIDGTAAGTVKAGAADGADAKGVTDDLSSVVTITSTDIAIVNTDETKAFYDAGTPFYVDNNGDFSLGDKLKYDNSENLLTISGAVTIESVSGLTKSDVGLGNVDNDSTETILAGNLTGSVNDVAVSTVTDGAAAGATAKGVTDNLTSVVAITSSDIAIVLEDETKTFNDDGTPFYVDNTGQFSLGDKLSYDPATNTLSITGAVTIESVSGLNKADVGLGNVDNNSTETILSGDLTGSIDGTAVATVKSGAADGASAKAETDKLTSVVSLTNSDIAIVNTDETKTFYDAGTPFYVDNTGDFSLGDKLKYDNSENLLTISGAVTIESVSGLTKSDVGLGNVDNTSTADILDGTAGDFTGDVTGTVAGTSASTVKSNAADGATAKGVTDNLESNVTLTSTKIYQGTGTFNNSNTGFYLDNTGQFSLKDKLSFDGTTLSVDGEITSTSGNIGGWQINSTELKSPPVSGVNRLKFSPTSGFIVNDDDNNTALLVNYGALSSLSSTTTGVTFADVSNAEVTTWDETVSAGNTLITIPNSSDRYEYSSNYLTASFVNDPHGGSYSYEISVDSITGAIATLTGTSSYLKATLALHVQIATDTNFANVIKDVELYRTEVTGATTITFPGVSNKAISFSISDSVTDVYLRFYWYRMYVVAYSDSITWSPKTFNVSSADANDDLVFLTYNGTTELTNEGVQIINDPTTFFKVDRSNFTSGNPYVDIGGDVKIDGDLEITGSINIVGDVENSDVSVSNLAERLGEINTDITVGSSSSVDVTFPGNVTFEGTVTGGDVSVSNLETRLGEIDSNINIGHSAGVTITMRENLVVTGDLTVQGNTTTENSTQLHISDSLIHLADGNENSDSIDIGFVGHYSPDAGTTKQHAGIFRDADNGEWYIFDEYVDASLDSETNPSNVIDRTDTSFSLGVVNANSFKSSGLNVSSTASMAGITSSGDIKVNDNVLLKAGTGNDLRIYHNGTGSLIDNYTGALSIRNMADNQDVIISSDNGSGGTTQYFRADGANGTVILYQYGNKRFETTTSGVAVTGETTVSGNLVVDTDTFKVDATADRIGINSNTVSTARTYIYDADSNPDSVATALHLRGVYSGTKSAAGDHQKRGLYVDIDSSASGDTAEEHQLYGIQTDIRFTGLADYVAGVYGRVEANQETQTTTWLKGGDFSAVLDSPSNSASTTNVIGSWNYVGVQDKGDFGAAHGTYSKVEFISNRNANNGTAYGGYFEVEINSPNANTYTGIYGVRAAIDNNQGTTPSIGTSYLFYGDYQGTKATNAWGLYVQGDKHYLQGNLGVGTAPSYELDVSGNANVSGGYRVAGTTVIDSSRSLTAVYGTFSNQVSITKAGIALDIENSQSSGNDTGIRIRGARNAQEYSTDNLTSYILFSNHDDNTTPNDYDLAKIGAGMYDAGADTGYFQIQVNDGTSLVKALDIKKNKDATFYGSVTATSLIKDGGTSGEFLKADGSVDSNTYALSSHLHDDRYYTETESDARYGRKIFGDNWGNTPEAKYIKIEIPFVGGSGGSEMYFFDVYGYRDFGTMDSQLHYRVYCHARSNGTTTNDFNMDVKGVNVAANEEFKFAYKTVASSPTEVYINVLEDYSGIQINSIPLDEGKLNSINGLTVSSSETGPTGTTSIIPDVYLGTTQSVNAQTLDALDSTQFLRSDANDTATGVITLTNDLVIARGTTTVQSAHDLYIGGSGLASANSSIYIGNAGDGTGYGWEIYYVGTGSGNANRLQIKSENLGSPVTVMDIYQNGNVFFDNSVTATTFIGGLSGNASTASKWANGRTLSLTGDVTGSVLWDGSANATLTATVANDSHTHDGRYYTETESDNKFAPVKRGSVTVTKDTYTRVARVEGNNLSSAIRMTVNGTTGSVVVNCLSDISVNHSADIIIHSQAGNYTTLDIRIISNNNEDFDIYLSYTGGASQGTSFPAAIEIFPLNNETITFSPTAAAYSGATFNHAATAGQIKWGQSGQSPNIYLGANKVFHEGNDGVGSNLNADMLDGLHASSFVRTDQSSTISGDLTATNLYVGGYIYHSGDTNSYIRFVGGDDFQIVSGGRQVLRMDEGTDPDKLELGDSSTYTYTNGRLGINTSTPTQDLHVVGSALFGESSDVSYAAPVRIRNSADGFIGMVRTGVRTWAHNIGADGHYYLRNVDGTYNVLNITDDNKVGIGKTPSYQLDVNGSIRTGGNLYVGTGGGFFYNDVGSRIRTNYDFYTNNSNTYLYATNLYLGAGSGDNVQVRGNRMYGNNWEIDTDGSAGFGTNSAASQVHIVDTAFPQLRVHDDTSGGKGGIRLKSHNGTNGLHADIYVQRTGNETGYMSFQVPYNGRELRLSNNGSLTLGIPGNGENNGGRYLSFEGNTDASGEGSGRLFFTEHNSSTAAMDSYGMSIGYRGGGTSVTTAGGNTWTGLSQIGNGQWGMWGHDNNLAGNLIMFGDRQATYVDFAGNNIQGITDIYVADQIIHTGDTDTYLQFHGADLFRVVIAGGEVTEWGSNYMKMRDSDTIRLGEGSDFRMWHDGTHHYFRNYNHAGGNIYWQGEDTEGTNHALIYMITDVSEPYVRLFANGVERLRTITGGVTAYGRIEIDDSNTKLLKGSGNALNITTNSGNVNIGPQNTSWCHFTTDRGGNYFDKKVIVNSGTIGSYDEDLSLVRANGTADRILIRSTSIGFFLDSAEDMRLENDGDLHVEGDVIAYSSTISDIRLKDEVKTIDNALGKIKSLRGVEYVWNKGHREGQKDLGLIAQEVEQVLPEIVREKKMPLMDDSDKVYKTVDYEKIVGVLIEAVKEQQEQIDELKARLDGGSN